MSEPPGENVKLLLYGGPADGGEVTTAAPAPGRYVTWRWQPPYHVYRSDLPFNGEKELVARYVGHKAELA